MFSRTRATDVHMVDEALSRLCGRLSYGWRGGVRLSDGLEERADAQYMGPFLLAIGAFWRYTAGKAAFMVADLKQMMV